MNPSQEPFPPSSAGTPPPDPTADPAAARPVTGSPADQPGGGAGAVSEPAGGSSDGGGAGGGVHGSPFAAEGGRDVWAGNPAGPVGFGGPEGGYGLAHPFGPEVAESPGFGRRFIAMQSSRRPLRRTLVATLSAALVVFLLGGPLGLLWAWLAPRVPVIETGQGGVVVNDPSPEEFIAADGWFTLLGVGFGILVAVTAWLVLRRDRGPFLLFGVVAGTLGAGYVVAPWAGEMIGRDAYEQWQQTAAAGATYMAPPEVHSLGPMLVPAFVAAIVLTLMAGWSNDPDLDEPGAKPGYGPNSEAAYGGPASYGAGPDAGYWAGYGPPSGQAAGPPFDQAAGSPGAPESQHGSGQGLPADRDESGFPRDRG